VRVTMRPAAISPQCSLIDSTREVILQALGAADWVVGGSSGAAARLGLKRTTLIAKMKKLGISRPANEGNLNHIYESLGPGQQAWQAA
jgi:transcriptional regulator with GAF, ATPase, and Fis domain